MPQENTLNQVLAALDAVTEIKWNFQLVEIAIDHCEQHTDKNFDRVNLLLQCYKSIYLCHIENLEYALKRMQQAYALTDLKDKSPVLQHCATDH